MSALTRHMYIYKCLVTLDSRMSRFYSSETPVKPGDVVYRHVPEMPSANPRPCVVVTRNGHRARLVPCSSRNWNPSYNPWIHLKDGGVSFLILDHAFTVEVKDCEAARFCLSQRAFATCWNGLKLFHRQLN